MLCTAKSIGKDCALSLGATNFSPSTLTRHKKSCAHLQNIKKTRVPFKRQSFETGHEKTYCSTEWGSGDDALPVSLHQNCQESQIHIHVHWHLHLTPITDILNALSPVAGTPL